MAKEFSSSHLVFLAPFFSNALNCANLKFDLEGANLMSSLVRRKTIKTIREQTLLPHPNIRNDNTNINENADDEPTFCQM